MLKLAQKTQLQPRKQRPKKLLMMPWMLLKAKLMPWAQQPLKQPKKLLMPLAKLLMPLKTLLKLLKKQLNKRSIHFRKRAVLGRPFFFGFGPAPIAFMELS